MKRQVRVKIIGRQEIEEVDKVEKELSASYYFRNKCHYLLFDENDFILRLKASREEVILNSHTGKMIFDMDRETRTSYYTPYGCLEMEIDTRDIKIHKKEDLIAINLCYKLSSVGEIISENIVDIIIEPE